MRVIKALRAGITWVNTYHPTYSEAPWGGYKQSGIGRELGSFGLDEYTEVKQINIDLTDAPMGVYQRGKKAADGRRQRAGQGRAAERPPAVPRGRDDQGRGLGPVLRELQALTQARRGGAAADRAPAKPAHEPPPRLWRIRLRPAGGAPHRRRVSRPARPGKHAGRGHEQQPPARVGGGGGRA